MRFRLMLVGVAVTALVAVGCGDDSDEDASSTSTEAVPAETTEVAGGEDGASLVGTEYCDLAEEMFNSDSTLTAEQLQQYLELAPEEIAGLADTAVSAALPVVDDPVQFFAVVADDEVESALHEINAFEEERCGLPHSEEEAPLGEGGSRELESDAAEVDVVASEYTFDIPTVSAGRTSFVLTNEGEEAHFLMIMKLADGVTLDQALQSEDGSGAEGVWSTLLAAPGGEEDEVISFDVEAGDYGAVCFIPGADGQPHVASGMAVPFTVA
jgi:hypothetical protein